MAHSSGSGNLKNGVIDFTAGSLGNFLNYIHVTTCQYTVIYKFLHVIY